ncbi:OLC1v1036097C1 [Oldenlandia corymbosa var. corymbosa]|uniref:Membrin n=1 Tax=Oldenlandia corymbosa var. corymbosa TaxID=529605 RepID=A0AAV1CXR0_OLDCO|nr:OLC1v1036097C1 [Oldenlandia corymbosa var. corymbosa]
MVTTTTEFVARTGGARRVGGTLPEIHQNSKKLLLEARAGLEKLERLEYSSSSLPSSSLESSPEVFDAVKTDISHILSLCAEMDFLWRSYTAKSERDLWKRKVEQVAEEVDSLKNGLDKYSLRHQRRKQEAQERAELLGRTIGESSHILSIYDEEAQERQSVKKSSAMLQEAYETGVAILSKYSDQRDHLKRAQRKALDVLNRLGLSNSVLRLIERRNRMDRWVKYAGMVITIIIVITIWRWTST